MSVRASRPVRRGTLREEQKRATRAKLVAAARNQFESRGYAAVTVDEIASEVGCSRATFYVHFPGKLEILEAVSAEATSVMSYYEDLDRVLETRSRAEFTQWLARVFEWFQENRRMLPAYDEAVALEPELRTVARRELSALPNAMTQFLGQWPEEDRDEARLRIELLLAQLERFFTRWAVQGTIDVSAERATAVLTDIWFPALTEPGRHSAG
ncbi:TetR/AcrR family transcriptional regulator [Prescottella equi]|uniref:TetR/AcrR family transcriptional regulator n=1 Tax=Rhodococcus hoagii TaxID=43767 RepID=UPI000A10040B|nr:TetR/AcrR family transcriptional regulator [Prescottella equi]NKR44600.1 TetR family transcriptional regulator [Prescottella equi]NKR75032.1 TetR family transcriptional regulator [Prescottella equi]ORJ92981.1 TetR family transcriptional regulator [Prescottella equi]